MTDTPITVEQMREHAPGPWKWRLQDPADLPPGIQAFIRRQIEAAA